MQVALAIYDLVQAAHGRRALQKHRLDTVRKAEASHLAADWLVWRVAIENLHHSYWSSQFCRGCNIVLAFQLPCFRLRCSASNT